MVNSDLIVLLMLEFDILGMKWLTKNEAAIDIKKTTVIVIPTQGELFIFETAHNSKLASPYFHLEGASLFEKGMKGVLI